jgi:putative transposase
MGWKRLAQIATIAKADTIRGWHRLMQKGQLGAKRSPRGRPRTDRDIEQVVIRMARENPTWGQLRIAAMLTLCLIPLSPRTIAAILARHGLKHAPERTVDWSWTRFITENADALVATDFFTVDVRGWFGTLTYDVLFAVHLGTRRAEILGVTQHANEAFMAQVAREATAEGGWLQRMGCRYLIHDRDSKFCGRWKGVLEEAGIKPTPTPPHSPNMNAFAERWVRTIKHECIRRCTFLDYGGLRRVLREFVDHYNLERPHQSKGNRPLTDFPDAHGAARKYIADFKASDIRCVTRCGGVIRHYFRVAA